MYSKNVKVPVETYSRVVGYFRPVSQWNRGKASEFDDRLTLDLKLAFKQKRHTKQIHNKEVLITGLSG